MKKSPELHRRDLLLSSAATAGLLAMVSETASAAPGGEAKLLAAADAQTQKFPWGWIRWLMSAQIDPQAEMTLGIVSVEPGQTNPLHVHPNSAEFLHMLSGSCEHRIGDRWVPLKAGDTLRVPKGMQHQARTAKEGFRAVIVYDTGTRQMVPVKSEEPKT